MVGPLYEDSELENHPEASSRLAWFSITSMLRMRKKLLSTSTARTRFPLNYFVAKVMRRCTMISRKTRPQLGVLQSGQTSTKESWFRHAMCLQFMVRHAEVRGSIEIGSIAEIVVDGSSKSSSPVFCERMELRGKFF